MCLTRILPAFVNDADFVDMFVREARSSALPHHTHIARALDLGIADGTHILHALASALDFAHTATPPASSTATCPPRKCCDMRGKLWELYSG
ncbi:MAG: hypothetical protein WCE62_07210 [Polyangiales bacterium]